MSEKRGRKEGSRNWEGESRNEERRRVLGGETPSSRENPTFPALPAWLLCLMACKALTPDARGAFFPIVNFKRPCS